MKKLLIIIDGMEDEPCASLGGKTPKEVAYMPGLEFMRLKGHIHMMKTIPQGNIPSSDTAILNILGNHVEPGFSGRTWLEAIGSGIDVSPRDLCIRCNLIRTENHVIASHCSETLTEEVAKGIIELLNRCFGSDKVSFHYGLGYRNLLVIKDCIAEVKANPVHEMIGSDVSALAVRSNDTDLQDLLNSIIFRSMDILSEACGEVNGIALWAPGHIPSAEFIQRCGAVVAGTNLVKGIGKACGLKVIDVMGATGDGNTNYSGKLKAVLEAFEDNEFVLLHIEAPDEASHQRKAALKIQVLEKIDRFIIAPLLKYGKDLEIVVQSDHATSSVTGRHLDKSVEVITYVMGGRK